MNNLEVIKKFLKQEDAKTNLRNILHGYYYYKGRTLQTKQEEYGFCLYNYDTVIAFIMNNTLYLNTKKYSTTTSKIQTQLKSQAQHTDYIIKEYIEMKGGK